jgi:hypothetical protein
VTGSFSPEESQILDPFIAVDRLLAARYFIGLEEALCEGCLTGKLRGLLAEDAAIIRRCTHMQNDEDGGQSFTFEGVFAFFDVRYNFRCYVFIDGSDQRFLSDVAVFEPIEWQARMAVS